MFALPCLLCLVIASVAHTTVGLLATLSRRWLLLACSFPFLARWRCDKSREYIAPLCVFVQRRPPWVWLEQLLLLQGGEGFSADYLRLCLARLPQSTRILSVHPCCPATSARTAHSAPSTPAAPGTPQCPAVDAEAGTGSGQSVAGEKPNTRTCSQAERLLAARSFAAAMACFPHASHSISTVSAAASQGSYPPFAPSGPAS